MPVPGLYLLVLWRNQYGLYILATIVFWQMAVNNTHLFSLITASIHTILTLQWYIMIHPGYLSLLLHWFNLSSQHGHGRTGSVTVTPWCFENDSRSVPVGTSFASFTCFSTSSLEPAAAPEPSDGSNGGGTGNPLDFMANCIFNDGVRNDGEKRCIYEVSVGHVWMFLRLHTCHVSLIHDLATFLPNDTHVGLQQMLSFQYPTLNELLKQKQVSSSLV